MIYQVQDTPEGFRLVVKTDAGKHVQRRNFEGSHGAIARAYGLLERIHTDPAKDVRPDDEEDTIERVGALAEIFSAHEFGCYAISAVLPDDSRVVKAYSKDENRLAAVFTILGDGSYTREPGDDSEWVVPE